MQLSEAVDLISGSITNQKKPEMWADLGCGAGMFTRALAEILPEGSAIVAVDKIEQKIGRRGAGRSMISFVEADFENETLNLPPLDGILMANSLHFVADKPGLLTRLAQRLTERGRFIIVEYDTLEANPWVPYPIDFPNLKRLFTEIGYSFVKKLAERSSSYGRANLYVCVIGRDDGQG